MSRYFYVYLDRPINKISLENYLLTSLNIPLELTWLTDNQCYFISDANLNTLWSSMIEVIASDFGCVVSVLSSHNEDSFSQRINKWIGTYRKGEYFNLAEAVYYCLQSTEFREREFFIDYFEKIDEELILTIHNYLLNNCDGLLTAKKMYLHRNTWLYRLNKFVKLTNLDVRFYENALFFELWYLESRI